MEHHATASYRANIGFFGLNKTVRTAKLCTFAARGAPDRGLRTPDTRPATPCNTQFFTMANRNLKEAKAAKNDEFYTQYHDIEIEMNAYLEYDPDVFRDKTVLLPCDDPEWSNFTRYFAAKFDELGLHRLVSTSYAPDSKRLRTPWQPTLFEQDAPQFDPAKTQTRGKIFILERDRTGDGHIDLDDLEWDYLESDGDFRSHEVTALRDEADFVITNPPFSLFREFLAWIQGGGRKSS